MQLRFSAADDIFVDRSHADPHRLEGAAPFNQREGDQNQEDHEQNLGDYHGCADNSAEAQRPRLSR